MSAGIANHLQLLCAALLFSTGGAAIKLSAMSSWQIACFRSLLAAAVFALLLRPDWRRCLRPDVLGVASAYATVMVLFVAANKLTSAANAIFLQNTSFLWVLALGPLLLREPTKSRDLGFAAGIVAGMALIFFGAEAPTHSAANPPVGNLLGMLTGCAWGMTLIGLRYLARTSDTTARRPAECAVLMGNVIAGLACLPLALPIEAARTLDWWVVGYLGVFQMALAYLFMTRAMRRLPVLEIALLLLFEPILTGVWAWLLHGEQPGGWSLAGYAAILISTLWRALLIANESGALARLWRSG